MENQPPFQQPQQQYSFNPQTALPNATPVLVLGIIGIVGCFCYGILGIICATISLVLAGKDLKLYNANPSAYTETSIKNLRAGRICAIIGLCLSIFYILIIIFLIATIGFAALSNPSHFLQNMPR